MIRVTAPAKINFFLEITGKRPDGYHLLSTVFQTISLGDELEFSAADELSLTCSDPSLPVDQRNLVMKAAFRLQEVLREPRGAKIHLNKKVPTGAGLGGGSSDAASALLALLKLWGRRPPDVRRGLARSVAGLGSPQLRRLAVALGADVPFFLKGGICSATGIGEKLKSLPPIPKTWMVLVYPGFGVSTKEAYAKVMLPFADPPTRRASDPRLSLFNRFESLVFPDHPELPRLKSELLEAGATASLMSGSGSSVFGLASSRAQGEKILAHLQKKYNHCWLVHTL
jgi:4-diphosphocytidyl-2-C-methyl-D-erythritol kinase